MKERLLNAVKVWREAERKYGVAVLRGQDAAKVQILERDEADALQRLRVLADKLWFKPQSK